MPAKPTHDSVHRGWKLPPGEQALTTRWDTVRRVTDQLVSGEKLFFIIGSDAFAEVTLWYKWREVAAAVEFIVVSRPGTDFGLGEAPKGIRAHWLGGVELPISSTDVRERLRSGAKADELLPSEVAEYVSRHGLYRA